MEMENTKKLPSTFPFFYTGRSPCKPTIFPTTNFNVRGDAEEIHKATRGFCNDIETLITIICHRDFKQRIEIAKEYKTLFGVDLKERFKKKLSGNLKNLMMAMVTPLPHFFAQELHDAMYGPGTNESVIIEILCTLTNYGIRCIVDSYEKLYGRTLERDLISDTSGHFRRLCISLIQGNRNEDIEVDITLAQHDAKRLYDAGVAMFGTDESIFNSILVSRSYHHLRQVFVEYHELAQHTINHAIEAEFSGDIKQGHLTIVKCIKSKSEYYAERLHKSMKGLGTDDEMLIRVIVTRSEIDLGDIKYYFEKLYGGTLEEWITDDTSGDYRKALLKIVRGY